MPPTQSTNVLIVGSGIAGGLIAEQLLEQGIRPVTMCEAGPHVLMADRRLWLDAITTGQYPYNHLKDTLEDYEAAAEAPAHRWHIEGGRLFARGGSTLHWGGICPRMKPEDFALASSLGRTDLGLDW